MTRKAPRARNTLHNHPLLGKGGAHGRTRKAERRRERARLSQGRWPDPSDCPSERFGQASGFAPHTLCAC